MFCFFKIGGNGRRYETLGISELGLYHPTQNFDARQKVRLTTYAPMFYDRLLCTGGFVVQVLNMLSFLIV